MEWSFKHLRISLFFIFLRPFSRMSRNRRMREYVFCMKMHEGMSVLDLGGDPTTWASVKPKLNLTILNLEDVSPASLDHNIRYVLGNACNVVGFADKSFDSVFSNSVIEHVGDEARRAEFAREVRRLGRSYWVQTPSKWFPIEAHCGLPFWWFYPKPLRKWIIARWWRKLQGNPWAHLMLYTEAVSKAELRRLFPEASILVERVLGIPKSYMVFYRE